ncbi:calcium-binding protein [Nocardiopsis nanhaiensis]
MSGGKRGPEQEGDRRMGQQRGGSPSAISGALKRDPHPGPQHWGGPRPRRVDRDPFLSSALRPPPGRRKA